MAIPLLPNRYWLQVFSYQISEKVTYFWAWSQENLVIKQWKHRDSVFELTSLWNSAKLFTNFRATRTNMSFVFLFQSVTKPWLVTGSVMTNTTLWIAALMVETVVWKIPMAMLLRQKSFVLTVFVMMHLKLCQIVWFQNTSIIVFVRILQMSESVLLMEVKLTKKSSSILYIGQQECQYTIMGLKSL